MLKHFVSQIREALAEPEPEKKPDTSELDALNERYDKGVERVKDTAKWILSVFAAVAGVLLAGLQLANIGKVEPAYLILAVLGYAIGLSAVLAVVWLAFNVLMAGTVTKEGLLEYASRDKTPPDINLNDPLMLGGYTKVADFLKDYEEIGKQYNVAKQAQDKQEMSKLEPKTIRLVTTWKSLRPIARYAIVLHRFHQTTRGMFVGAAIAAIAIGVFTWATSRVTLTNPVFQEPPSAVSVTLTEAGKRALREGLGGECVEQSAIAGILLSIEGGSFEVVTIPSSQCRVAKFTVDADTGSVVSAGSPIPTTASPITPTPTNGAITPTP